MRRNVLAQLEATVGRHDQRELYGGEPGDLGLTGGPNSISWEIHGDLASLLVAGTGAILMELLHPSVMAGVYTYSSYRTEQLRRTQNTLGYVLSTTFGSTPAATAVIERVKRVHGRIHGVRPDGVEFCALDAELIGWVHTCIPWAVMTAYDRYVRPLSTAEKNRYLREQAVIGRMGGAAFVPETTNELDDYVASMRSRMAVNEQFLSFMSFVEGRGGGNVVGRAEQWYRWSAVRASMDLMPDWAQRLMHTEQPELVRRILLRPSDRLKARLIRWACPELACKRMAIERAMGATAGLAPKKAA